MNIHTTYERPYKRRDAALFNLRFFLGIRSNDWKA